MNLSQYFETRGRGSATQLAEAIGAHSSDLSNWTNGQRPVPVKFAVAIESATDRAVTRKDLFPTDWYLIWPELEAPAAAPEVAHVA